MSTASTVHDLGSRSSTISDLAYDVCTDGGLRVPVTRVAWRRIRRTARLIRCALAGRTGALCCRVTCGYRPVRRARRPSRRRGRSGSSSDGDGPGDPSAIDHAIEIGGTS